MKIIEGKNTYYIIGNIAYLPLSKGKCGILDAIMVPITKHFRWRTHQKSNKGYYVRTGQRKNQVDMHQLFMQFPLNLEIDHRNRNGMDNRISNLRLCTHIQNCHNSGPRNGKQFKGVRYRPDNKRNPFRASIHLPNRNLSLGYYPTIEGAARAVDRAALKYYGEFAYLNFPEEAYGRY